FYWTPALYKYVLVPISESLSTLSSRGAVLEVASSVYAAIRDVLTDTDWTYLKLSYGRRVEIIKVVGRKAPNKLVVQRAQDNTTKQTFPIGSTLAYAPTAIAIQEQSISSLNIVREGTV